MNQPTLKTVEQHNAEQWSKLKDTLRTGVKCPKCDGELIDTKAATTTPKNVYEPQSLSVCFSERMAVCEKCGATAYIL